MYPRRNRTVQSMSQLQLSLLILGAVVIGGVVAYNWLQERMHRKRAERAFDQPPADVLFDRVDPGASLDAAPANDMSDVSIDAARDDWVDDAQAESSSDGSAASAEFTRAPAAHESGEPEVDCVVVFDASAPLSGEALRAIVDAFATLARPVRVTGFDERSGHWMTLDDSAPGRFTRARAAMQIADRQAMASRAELDAFVALANAAAEHIDARASQPDLAEIETRARELDAFCAEVDIAIGLSVVARTGQHFQGTTIRALAESAGLTLKADGQFHFEDAHGASQFTLDNQDTEPFFPESMKSLTTSGITFLLDVPRASGGLASFDRMVQLTKKFAATLDGLIVDDNRQPLNDNGLGAIRRHLSGVYVAMEAAGIPAGGLIALRLFA
jgi:FtsZ-interacting cell division protein ZipA